MAARIGGALAALVIGIATALTVVGLAVLVFLNPVWVGLEQERAESGLLTGYGPVELRAATDAILSDLVFGPPDFDVEVAGSPVLTERERGHMRDVRSVLVAFYAVVAAAILVLLVAWLAGRRAPARRARTWRRIGRGARILVVATIAVGVAGLLFFDQAFELFHRLFFPAGTYTFDPGSERLVQLFPNQFWVDTTLALGVVIVLLGGGVASFAGARARRADAQAAALAVAEPPPTAPPAPEAPPAEPLPADAPPAEQAAAEPSSAAPPPAGRPPGPTQADEPHATDTAPAPERAS